MYHYLWYTQYLFSNVMLFSTVVKEYVGLFWKIFGIIVFGCVTRTVIACLVGILFIHIAQTPLKEFEHFLNFENWTEEEFFEFR